MKVLVIGSGGREHALVWKLKQSPMADEIFCSPGNAGIAEIATCVDTPVDDIPSLLWFVQEQGINLTVVGPEAPLCAGIVDVFRREGHAIFGPTQKAAQLEGSKVFTKNLLREFEIPTAPYKVFSNPMAAKEYLMRCDFPVVIKAEGLAAGKGVVICHTELQAFDAVSDMMLIRKFGAAGRRIIIEDCLKGEEASCIFVVDAKANFLSLASSQDHKRVRDGDKGPNTGGMGAYSPAPIVDLGMEAKIVSKIINPLLIGMRKKGIPFSGFLYAGLMIVDGEPYVLEFNVRLGDPETQPILMRMESDLLMLINLAIDGYLKGVSIEWREDPAVCVVAASKGYPNKAETGFAIDGLDSANGIIDTEIFHAGTAINGNGELVTSGGRVLGVTVLGKDIQTAKDNAYAALEKINFSGMHYRTDIADRAIKREERQKK